MGSVHNELRHGAWSRAVRNALQVEEAESGLERFSETLQVGMDLWRMPEWALLRGEIYFSKNVNAAVPGAGRFASHELVNPAKSGVLVVVERIDRTGGTPGISVVVDSGTAIAANPVLTQGVANDTRYPQLGQVSILQITSGDVAAVATNIQYVLNAQQQTCLLPFVIAPGKKLFLISDTAAAGIFNNFFWRERAADVGELTARG